MSLLSMDDLVAGLSGSDRCSFQKQAISSVANNYHSLWRAAGLPSAGAVPPTGAGAAPTRATAGAIAGWTNPGVGDDAYLAHLTMASDDTGMATLYDRLVHTSGLNGTLTTAQAINTAALTRYTSGAGVEAWLEFYTTVATSRTATISYTNQAGTAGRTGTLTTGTNPPASRMIPFALEAGDTGVRSVESLTLSGSTGAVGDFGITLLRRLADLPMSVVPGVIARDAFDLGLPVIEDDACLALMTLVNSASAGPFTGLLAIAKG